jgi:predicted metallopeptidase
VIAYAEAPEVEKIARDLIDTIHVHLVDVRIDYLFRDKAAVSGGKVRLGSARKVSGLTAFLGKAEEPFFVIEIAAEQWASLPEEARRALVDHELSHCGVDTYEDKEGTIKQDLRIIKHDLEEFNDIVRRHGLWRADVEAFAAALSELI